MYRPGGRVKVRRLPGLDPCLFGLAIDISSLDVMLSRAAPSSLVYMMDAAAAARKLHCTTRCRARLHFAASLAAVS